MSKLLPVFVAVPALSNWWWTQETYYHVYLLN